jgi:hypothetical protein
MTKRDDANIVALARWVASAHDDLSREARGKMLCDPELFELFARCSWLAADIANRDERRSRVKGKKK